VSSSFLPSLKRVSYLPSDDLRKDSIGAFREMMKAHMLTITNLYMSWVFHESKPWLVVIGQTINPLPNLESCVCFQKLK